MFPFQIPPNRVCKRCTALNRAKARFCCQCGQPMSSVIEIFLSYAHQDELFRQELEKHLAVLRHKDLAVVWHDRKISAGTQWERSIDIHLASSRIILLLISPDFMASDYCYSVEMKRALEMHQQNRARVIPVILRPVYWQIPPLDQLQALPKDAEPVTLWLNQDAAFVDIAQGVLNVVEGLSSPPLDAREKVSLAVGNGKTSPPSDAIYLMRVIDPPVWDGTSKTTAWLAAEGKTTYIVDSITLRHTPYLSLGAGHRSGAVAPDAQYHFSLVSGESRTYALNPALVLSHEDRQEVSLTLTLEPSQREGYVDAVLHYHAFSGVQGQLYLRTPPKEGVLLSRLLKTSVEVGGLIITPKGFQRGKDENNEEERETLVYKPISFPYEQFLQQFYVKEDGKSFSTFSKQYLLECRSLLQKRTSVPMPLVTLTPERLALNRAIETKKLLPYILDLLAARNYLAFDLCAGLLSPECEQMLVQVGLSGQKVLDHWYTADERHWLDSALGVSNNVAMSALSALSIRHMLEPSEILADFVLSLDQAYATRQRSPMLLSNAKAAFVALTLHRKGKWIQALLTLTTLGMTLVSNKSGVLDMLSATQESLTREEIFLMEELIKNQ